MRLRLENKDCMEVMAEYPDKYFDLAVVDPPYGIGFSNYERCGGSLKIKKRYTKNGDKLWDYSLPNNKYFNELFRVSKNQIVWGGNYFELPPTQCIIFWYKQNPVPNFADGELAWTNFNKPASCFDYRYYGSLEGGSSRLDERIHPTQKPIELYKWILKHYANPEMKIIDTHLGSGSSLIAADSFGIAEFVGCELDKDYFEAMMKRYNTYKSQERISFDKVS